MRFAGRQRGEQGAGVTKNRFDVAKGQPIAAIDVDRLLLLNGLTVDSRTVLAAYVGQIPNSIGVDIQRSVTRRNRTVIQNDVALRRSSDMDLGVERKRAPLHED